MKRELAGLCSAGLNLYLFACGTLVAADLKVFAGTWKGNPSKSVFSMVPEETVEIKDNPDGSMTQTTLTRGAKETYTFRVDGKPYERANGRASSWKQLGPLQWEITSSVGGKINSTTRRSISKDGLILTVHINRPETTVCLPPSESRIYRRTSKESNGLVGAWRASSFRTDAPLASRIEVSADGQMTFHQLGADSSSDFTITAKLDGKDNAVAGRCASAGMTASVIQVNDSKLEITSKRGGDAFQINTWTLSSDGRTLVDEARDPATNNHIHRVTYERQ